MTKEMKLLLEFLPPEVRPLVMEAWGGLPPDMRRECELTLGGFVKLFQKSPGSITDFLQLVQRTAGPAVTPLTRVAVVGPVNVGKSTLYNALVTDPEQRADESPIPGTTREAKTGRMGLFDLVDTPGADHGATIGLQEKELAFEAARQADFLVIVFDATSSVKASDKVLYTELKALGKPHLVALNKIDLVSKSDRRHVVRAAAGVLGLDTEAVIPISAEHREGIEKLVLEVAASEPNLLARFGELMPEMRRKLGWQAIRRAAVASALVALTPIPLTDVIPLTAIQASMVLTLARIYEQEIGFTRAVELLSTFGAGWLARLLFQELSKLAGVPGWVLSASIATSATIAIGYTSMLWFETGKKPTQADVSRVAKSTQKAVTGVLTGMGKKKPNKKTLTQELEEALPKITEPAESAADPQLED